MDSQPKGIANLPIVRWAALHPRVAAWIVLSVGMVILLVLTARDVGLLPGQWIALISACILVSGACIWIISWEDRDEDDAVSAAAETDADSSKPPASPTNP